MVQHTLGGYALAGVSKIRGLCPPGTQSYSIHACRYAGNLVLYTNTEFQPGIPPRVQREGRELHGEDMCGTADRGSGSRRFPNVHAPTWGIRREL